MTKKKKTKNYIRKTPAALLRKYSKMSLTPELQASLKEILLADRDYFRNLPGAKVIETRDGPSIFIDNGADIIAAGHIDYVDFNLEPNLDFKNMTIDKCPQLDDRLGVWVLLHLLPSMYPGLKYDIILCDSEELGNSTAKDWDFGDKKYNFGFEFDRAGTDSVTYEYSDVNWDDAVSEFSQVGQGAFSDICELERLGCKMVNVGVGYHEQHSAHCWADLEETVAMCEFFGEWATINQNVWFKHTEEARGNVFGYSTAYSNDFDDEWADWDTQCEVCGTFTNQDLLCRGCQSAAQEMLLYSV